AEIHRVHAIGKGQEIHGRSVPATGAVSQLSLEWLPRRLAGRSKTVRSEAAQALMQFRVVTDQAAPGLVEIPDFLARHRFVRAYDVEAAAVSVAPVERRLHPGTRGHGPALHDLAHETREPLLADVHPGTDRALALLERGDQHMPLAVD